MKRSSSRVPTTRAPSSSHSWTSCRKRAMTRARSSSSSMSYHAGGIAPRRTARMVVERSASTIPSLMRQPPASEDLLAHLQRLVQPLGPVVVQVDLARSSRDQLRDRLPGAGAVHVAVTAEAAGDEHVVDVRDASEHRLQVGQEIHDPGERAMDANVAERGDEAGEIRELA